MILELDTDIYKKLPKGTSLHQWVFISLLLKDSDKKDNKFPISLIDGNEMMKLVLDEYIIIDDTQGEQIVYKPGNKLLELMSTLTGFFDEFYAEFPSVVLRPDGTKSYLRTNMNRCRKFYEKEVGKSKAKHTHILKCLREELKQRLQTSKLGYLKGMWNWLTQHEWENYEEAMKHERPINEETQGYGTNVI